MRDEAVETVLQGLLSGSLRGEDLTARRLSALVGRTTSVLYHHFGSLDGFLFEVSQRGFAELLARLPLAADGDLPGRLGAVAAAWIDFAVDFPTLYELMFERRLDWAALRAQGRTADSAGLSLLRSTIAALAAHGRPDPENDVRVLFGGLHGLASLAISGRANAGNLAITDRDAARCAARHLVHCLFKEGTT